MREIIIRYFVNKLFATFLNKHGIQTLDKILESEAYKTTLQKITALGLAKADFDRLLNKKIAK
jgi:hypothetical protein